MSNSFDDDFQALEPLQFAPSRPIKSGDSGTHHGVADLAENSNSLVAQFRPTIVSHCSQTQPDTLNYVNVTDTSYEMIYLWRQRVLKDFSHLRVTVRFIADVSGWVKCVLRSDDSTYTAEAQTPHYSPGYNSINFQVAQNVSVDLDTVELWAKSQDGATTSLRIQSIEITPEPLSSPLSAGLTATGISPIDVSGQCSQDKPMSTYLINEMMAGAEILHKKRQPTIVSWSSDVRSDGLENRLTSYSSKILIWFDKLTGSNRVQWSAFAHKSSGSGVNKIEIKTGYMVANGIDPIEVEITSSSWASPFDGSKIDSTSGTELTCDIGSGSDYIEVSIKGDGSSTSYLQGLTAWVKEVG